MYCHKCGKLEQKPNSFCRSCGSYLPDVDELVRNYLEKNSPEKKVNKNLLANLFGILLSIFTVLSIAFIFAGESFAVIFVHLAVLLSFAVGGWQLINLKNNLKLKKLIKEKRFPTEPEKQFRELGEGDFSGITIAEIIAQNTSGSLQLNEPRFRQK